MPRFFMLYQEFGRRASIYRLETLGKIGMAVETDTSRNLRHGIVGLQQELGSYFQPLVTDKFNRRQFGYGFQLTVKIGTAQPHFTAYQVDIQFRIGNVLLYHLKELLRELVCSGNNLHSDGFRCELFAVKASQFLS